MKAKRIPTGQLFGTSPINRIVPQRDFPAISPRLEAMLQQIATELVSRLGCVGSIVTTLERGNALPVRAYSMRFAPELLERMEEQAGVSLMGPEACVYLDDPRYEKHLSTRAVLGYRGRPERYIITDRLGDLLVPITTQEFAETAQKMTGIRQIIALPFFIDGAVVGNLFAATRDAFTQRDIDFISGFGQQAANAVQSQRQLDEMQALERVILELQSNISDETAILQTTVDAVVHKLGYVGAMVSTVEPNNTLPLRVFRFDVSPSVSEQVEPQTRDLLTRYQEASYLHDPEFARNLGARAIMQWAPQPGKRYLESEELYDLFRPAIAPALAREVQQALRVQRVIALPFFIEDEPMGSISVLSRKPGFSEQDRAILTAFAQQAAVGLRNARLYRRSQEQRRMAQALARMAFGASAYVHTLRNHISAVGNYLMLTPQLAHMGPERLDQMADIREHVLELVDQSVDILDNLHEPWQQKSDAPTDVNRCIYAAVNKLYPNLHVVGSERKVDTQHGVVISFDLAPALPEVTTAPEMMTEVFNILLTNAVEAMDAAGESGRIWFTSRRTAAGDIEVSIQDNGTGIQPQHVPFIFDIGFTTRENGMGFGLFWMKDYVEALGGSVDVATMWKQGTKFTLMIPAGSQPDTSSSNGQTPG